MLAWAFHFPFWSPLICRRKSSTTAEISCSACPVVAAAFDIASAAAATVESSIPCSRASASAVLQILDHQLEAEVGLVVPRDHAAGHGLDQRAARRTAGQDGDSLGCIEPVAAQLCSIMAMASASDTSCTPHTKLLINFISAPLPAGPR